ncbi:MAG TPA: hypothetical protein PLK80_05755 [bacterium]|nr:MAG: hypothetical protein BWY28_02648 [bacterium ADurb.Bin236]HOY64469.1 hypothetical protein [bacterium]HPI76221.1 hypothetical protein [bacterium]
MPDEKTNSLKICIAMFAGFFFVVILVVVSGFICIGETRRFISVSDDIVRSNENGFQMRVRYVAEDNIMFNACSFERPESFADDAIKTVKANINKQVDAAVAKELTEDDEEKLKHDIVNIVEAVVCQNGCDKGPLVEIYQLENRHEE